MEASQLAALADEFYAAQRVRLELDKKAEEAKKVESFLREQILAYMAQEKVFNIGSATVQVNRHLKPKPSVKDWNMLYQYITNTGSFDLLHKRVTEKAVELRWEDGQEVPGVEKFIVEKLTVTKKE